MWQLQMMFLDGIYLTHTGPCTDGLACAAWHLHARVCGRFVQHWPPCGWLSVADKVSRGLWGPRVCSVFVVAIFQLTGQHRPASRHDKRCSRPEPALAAIKDRCARL
jgi:hypothetical protein